MPANRSRLDLESMLRRIVEAAVELVDASYAVFSASVEVTEAWLVTEAAAHRDWD